jgi:hypothetical protein
VSVNLRVKTMETEQLGLEEHICEVLLILRTFAELVVSLIQAAVSSHLRSICWLTSPEPPLLAWTVESISLSSSSHC